VSLPPTLTLPTWVDAFFDAHYAETDLAWPRARQDKVADCVAKWLGVDRGARVFDQCCGTGGLALGLARRGLEVCALDQSETYVAAALARAHEEGVMLKGVVADAGTWRPRVPFDAAINWHSSIGYGGRAGGERILSMLRSSVRPGGRWLIEVVNRAHLDAHFRTHWTSPRRLEPWGEVVQHRDGHWEGDDLCQSWECRHAGAVVWSRPDSRCWHPPQTLLEDWVKASGDRVLAVCDSETGEPLSSASPRLILVAERGPR